MNDLEREELRVKIALERYTILLDKHNHPVDPSIVQSLALRAAGYGTAFIEAMWPTSKA